MASICVVRCIDVKKLSPLLLLFAVLFLSAGCGSLPTGSFNAETGITTGSSAPGDSAAPAVITAEDGYAEGHLGDVMRTAFFEFSVDRAYTCARLNAYTPASENRLLVAEITVKNISTYSMPMVDYDFQAQWGDYDDEDAYAFPISEPIIDNQMPAEYEIPIDGSVTYSAVFEVPSGNQDFSISFLEYFSNNTEGDVFFVYFTADAE